jgi:hypothetical protein
MYEDVLYACDEDVCPEYTKDPRKLKKYRLALEATLLTTIHRHQGNRHPHIRPQPQEPRKGL